MSDKDKEQKNKVQNTIINLLLVILLIVMIFLVWKLVGIFMSYVESRREYDELRSEVVFIQEDTQEESTITPESSEEKDEEPTQGTSQETVEEVKEPQIEQVCPISVDFETLWKVNEDIVGWLYIGALDISYPIVQGVDNNEYIYTSVKGTANSSGSIFMEALNSSDFSDIHTIIYGHNMKDGSMFGKLKKLGKQENVDAFVEETGYYLNFWIITPEADYRYDIFNVDTVSATGEEYTLFPEADESFLKYMDKVARGTIVSLPKRSYDENDRVVTLSTCTGNDAYRLIVQGVRTVVEK